MPANPARVGDPDSFQSFFNSMPFVTKVFLVGNVLMGACITFKIISPALVVLDWTGIWNRFEFWRLFANFFFLGPFSLNFAMHTYLMYQNCQRYELNPYNTGAGGGSPDFLWMMMLSGTILLFIAYYFNIYFLSEPVLYVIMYVWSRRDPTTILNMFGFKFKAIYCPWVYMAIRMIMGGSITEPLIGIAVGHFYWFLIEALPEMPGNNIGTLIYTPKFCTDLVTYFTPVAGAAPTAYTAQPPRQNAARADAIPRTGAGGYNWGGGGRTLGRE